MSAKQTFEFLQSLGISTIAQSAELSGLFLSLAIQTGQVSGEQVRTAIEEGTEMLDFEGIAGEAWAMWSEDNMENVQ
jgi:hypothetical protein